MPDKRPQYIPPGKLPPGNLPTEDLPGGPAGNLAERGPDDRSRINVGRDWEMRWWAKKYNVAVEDLRAAVEAVGPSADAVAKHLGLQADAEAPEHTPLNTTGPH